MDSLSNWEMQMKRKAITIAFIVYVVCVFRITVFRPGISFRNLFQGTINVSLFKAYLPLLREGRWFRIIYLFGGNIVWFVPLGMYLKWLDKWKIRTIAVMGLLFSLFIETMQYILGTGISELDDLILNTLGAVIGAWIVGMLRRKIYDRKETGNAGK